MTEALLNISSIEVKPVWLVQHYADMAVTGSKLWLRKQLKLGIKKSTIIR